MENPHDAAAFRYAHLGFYGDPIDIRKSTILHRCDQPMEYFLGLVRTTMGCAIMISVDGLDWKPVTHEGPAEALWLAIFGVEETMVQSMEILAEMAEAAKPVEKERFKKNAKGKDNIYKSNHVNCRPPVLPRSVARRNTGNRGGRR